MGGQQARDRKAFQVQSALCDLAGRNLCNAHAVADKQNDVLGIFIICDATQEK
jgi:hypothetical protein